MPHYRVTLDRGKVELTVEAKDWNQAVKKVEKEARSHGWLVKAVTKVEMSECQATEGACNE